MKRSICGVVVIGFLAGCYSFQPAQGPAPKSGDRVALEITDLGRITLGGSMGPEIDQIEGRLLESENGDYLVGVTAVKTLRGGVQIWSGEHVRIEKQHVARLYQQRFSRGRTVALGVVVAGGVAFLVGRKLGVIGPGDRFDPPIDTINALVARP